MNARPAVPESVLHWIAAAIGVAIVPHLPGLPLWVIALIVAAIALRLVLRRPPGRWLLVPIVAAVFAAVLLQYRTLSGADAGGTFFAAMVALKFLESRDRRDAGLLICLTYFLATSVFLTDQSIAIAAYVLGSIVLTTTALITLAAPDGPPPAQRARRAALLLVQALPIMLVLFLLFPRVSGPLWGISQNPATAFSGLDDTMSPGSISDLLISDEVAFRVQFEGDSVPPRAQRYWRGPVLWRFDGTTWSQGRARVQAAPELAAAGGFVDYSLILEPHGRRWVLGLDLPVSETGDTRRTRGANLVSRNPVTSVRQYRLRSARRYELEPSLPPERRRRALEIPVDAAPQAQALAADWRRAAAGPQDVIDRALAMFRQQPFYYTLTPPRLTGDTVDEFLFDTREGFCEHYAGAFVFLMRAAGIPARVVTGYQGGEINAIGDYMIVRQSDAHAWAEVWLEGQGWTRIDPTNAVAPQRIQLGIANVAGAGERLGALSGRGAGVWRELALAWDSVSHAWNRLVLDYGPELQQRLLRRIGLGELGYYALSLVMIASAAFALAAVWLVAGRLRRERDPVLRLWRRSLARLRAAGLEPRATEAPATIARRVASHRPDLAGRFGRIVRLYQGLRYAPVARRGDVERLQREVSRFRPGRRRRRQEGPATASSRASKR
ncbi:MAG: DUF3488 and transglutaminase-like domain-containing protein [Halofilum sp. (in: g-proteobacteria)]|nr:DUF3488 and transglutaminase-like domain-containing protein [Halofilum sp. (in: g-proteobacteria)]